MVPILQMNQLRSERSCDSLSFPSCQADPLQSRGYRGLETGAEACHSFSFLSLPSVECLERHPVKRMARRAAVMPTYGEGRALHPDARGPGRANTGWAPLLSVAVD